MQKTNIRDPVHGQISLEEGELKIIDLPQFQRLRNICQLGFSQLVYPGAHHTRFEHSIGTLFLADKMASKLGLSGDERAQLRMAALLHDVGHAPFSHDSEEALSPILGTHEQIGAKIIVSSPFKETINENFDASKISSLAFGQGFGQLLCSDVGADRLDYLLRDAHYTGVAYGVIDWDRIIATLKWEGQKPVLEFGGLEAAESLMLARFLMFHTVYYHHAVRIARKMYQKALAIAIREKGIDAKSILREGDVSLLEKLAQIKSSKEYATALQNRQLYKRALVVEWKSLDEAKKKYCASKKFESELGEKFGSNALVDLPSKFSSPATIRIMGRGGKISPLEELSPIASSLEKAAEERATLLVCSPQKDAAKVCEYAKKLLGQ